MKARDNPFRTDRILEIRYELADVSWNELMIHLEQMRYRASIVGPHGSGKTTLLEDIESRMRALGWRTRWLRLDEDNRSFTAGQLDELFAQMNSRDILLLDGAEQLNALAWQQFKRRTSQAGGLIITTHQPGRLPTLHECQTSPDLLARIMARLLDEASEKFREVSHRLFSKHQGNVRDALRECYDLAASGSQEFSNLAA